MQGIEWLVVAVLAVGAVVVWRRHRYPGDWEDAFSGKRAAERAVLDAPRRRYRSLRARNEKERAQARTDVEQAETARRERVSKADHRLKRLRNPGPGARVGGLGRIALHDHVVRVWEEEVPLGDGPERVPVGGRHADIPLAGLHVVCEPAGSGPELFVRLRSASTETRLVTYLRAEFSERTVRQFCVKLENAAAKEAAFLDQRERDIEQTEAERAEAVTDTKAVEAAQARRTEVEARLASDPRVAEALEALDAEREVWQKRTGKAPPR